MKSENKKIIGFACALLIIAGIIVVVLKGFNVDLSLRQHDTFKFVFNQKFEKNDIDSICKEIFGEKEYEIKTVEVFTDAVYIISPTITDEEENKLIDKFSELYSLEENEQEEIIDESEDVITEESEMLEESDIEVVDDNNLIKGVDYDLYSDAKIRIRDIVNPYIIPSIISLIIILIYVGIKYRKLNQGKIYITILSTLLEMLLIMLSLLSIIAICRIPFQTAVIPILIFIILVCLTVRFAKYEKEVRKLNENA